MYTSRDAARVAATLALHAHPPMRAGEIAKAADVQAFQVQNGLRALRSLGLLQTGQERGHQVHRIDPETPYLPAVQLAGLIDVGFREALEPIRHSLRFALVIGSFAERRWRPDSDIDFLVVGDAARGELEDLLRPIGDRLEREVDVIAQTDAEFQARRAEGDPQLLKSTTMGVLILGYPELLEG